MGAVGQSKCVFGGHIVLAKMSINSFKRLLNHPPTILTKMDGAPGERHRPLGLLVLLTTCHSDYYMLYLISLAHLARMAK
jgi:hypothetical protein